MVGYTPTEHNSEPRSRTAKDTSKICCLYMFVHQERGNLSSRRDGNNKTARIQAERLMNWIIQDGGV